MSRCAPMLQRKRQVFGKIETTCGVYTEPQLIDGKTRVYVAPVADPQVEMNERNIARATLSRLNDVVGEKTVQSQFSTEVVGSGTNTVVPEQDQFIRACGYAPITVSGIAIGSITGGPFLRNETITGTTSSATGRVVIPATDGDTNLYIEVLTGTFTSGGETLTGSTSGATASSSAGEVAAGFAYTPVSSSFETLSIRHEEDGYVKKIAGAMGSFTITAEASKIVMFEFTMQGVLQLFGDQALTTGVTYYDTLPEIFVDAKLQVDRGTAGAFTPILATVTIDAANDIVVRKDANGVTGFVSAIVTGRAPTASMDPEMVLASEYDFYGKFFNGENASLGFRVGDGVAGNTQWVFADNIQYSSVADGERDSVAIAQIESGLKSLSPSGDDELEIVYL